MSEISSIDNKECLLVKFINDDDRILTGYKAWLVQKDTNVEDAILNDKIVQTSWPEGLTVSEATKMKKLIKKTTKWQKHPVKILAEGSKKKSSLSNFLIYFSNNLF